jgi:hypothetical protein
VLAPETAKPATPPSEPASNLEQLGGQLNDLDTRDAVRVQVLSIMRRCAVHASVAEALAPLVFGLAVLR